MTTPAASERQEPSWTSVLVLAAVPYGITVSLSCDLLILRRYAGLPHFGDVLAFALGSAAAFTALALAASAIGRARAPIDSAALLRTGICNSSAIVLAISAGYGLARADPWLVWGLSGGTVIGVYLGAVCLIYGAFASAREAPSRAADVDARTRVPPFLS